MKLVIDSNIAFLLFSRDPFIREFVANKEISLFSVKELIEELEKESVKICKITKRSVVEFKEILGLLSSIIELYPVKQDFLLKAESLISHKNDAPFLALALELNIPIWSNDKHFKEQLFVPVYTVSELKALLSDR